MLILDCEFQFRSLISRNNMKVVLCSLGQQNINPTHKPIRIGNTCVVNKVMPNFLFYFTLFRCGLGWEIGDVVLHIRGTEVSLNSGVYPFNMD